MIITRNNFTIHIIEFIQKNNKIVESNILLTSYGNDVLGANNTFDEQITEEPDGRYTFKFTVALYSNDQKNKMIDLLSLDRKIKVDIDGKIIEFYIIEKNPRFTKDNIFYTFNCQDAFSYIFSKQNIDMNFSTEDESIWGVNNTGPKSIDRIGEKILELCDKKHLWRLDPELNNHIYQFPDNLYIGSKKMEVSMNVTSTTAYNLFVEVAKLFNAIISVDYNKHYIKFLNKERLGYTGLTLRPESNLGSFSYSEKADNLYNIMHVTGGEDAYGGYVGIIPSMPSAVGQILLETYEESEDDSLNIQDEMSFYSAPGCKVVNGTVYFKTIVEKDGSFSYVYAIPVDANSDILNCGSSTWKNKNINDLKNFVLECYKNYYGKDSNNFPEISAFFQHLSKIPHCSSFLYNFDYWEEKGFLTSERKNNIDLILQGNLRNYNLLLLALEPLYNELNYSLKQYEDQEEEYMSLMAAEDKARGQYKIDNETELASRYRTYCKILDSTDGKKYYLPIGYKTTINGRSGVKYGIGYNNSYMGMSLPELYLLSSYENIKLVIIENDIAIQLNNVTFDLSGDTIMFNYPYASNMVYVEFTDPLQQFLVDNNVSVDVNTLDRMAYEQINILKQKVLSLWDENYFYINNIIHGNAWLEQKISDVKTIRETYINKQKFIENSLISMFGINWRDIDKHTLSFNSELFITYSDMLQEWEEYSIYVGGDGFRTTTDDSNKFYHFNGLYDYYLSMLESLQYTSDSSGFSNSLINKIEEIRKLKDKELKKFYKDYGDVIRETHYNDSEQITSSGLYNAAYKQFLIYQNTEKKYQSSYISTEDISGIRSSLSVGDIIKLVHKGIKESVVPGLYELVLQDIPLDPIDRITFIYKKRPVENPDNQDEIITDPNTYCEDAIVTSQNDNHYICKTYHFNINECVLIQVLTTKDIYGFNPQLKRILDFDLVYMDSPVKMRVTQITKNLREDSAKLAIEENTLFNSLVDRLIFFLK